MDVDTAGNVYVGGTASGAYSDGAVSFSIPTANGQDPILIKLDSMGNPVWGKYFSGSGSETFSYIKYSKDGTIVLGGTFNGSCTIGADSYTTRGGLDIFLARVKTDGTFINSWRIGGASSDSILGIDVGSDGSVCVNGAFTTSTDLGTGPVNGPGTANVFVAKYAPGSSIPTWYKFYTSSGFISIGTPSFARSNVVDRGV